MSWLVEYFGLEFKKTATDPALEDKKFEQRLEAYEKHKEYERKFANFDVKPQLPWANYAVHPMYEQYNKMFPHIVYTRRPKGQ